MTTGLTQTVRDLLEGPITRPALLRWRRQQFLSPLQGAGAYFGVYESFDEARACLPKNPEFDHEALAAEYVTIRAKKVFAYDYPVMLWLEHAFRGGASKVLDIGGSVGVHYFAYRRYIEMPAELSWHVVEVPSMVAVGRKMAEENQARALTFTEDLQEAMVEEACDIWIAAGAIHYLEDARPNHLVSRCASRPRHVLLNKLPLYGGEDFITAQNVGEGSIVPLHVYNKRRLVRDMEAQGYILKDEWPVHERGLYLPGHPQRSFPWFTGLYFVDQAASECSEQRKRLAIPS
ncbi:methyltransferase, TIGR04325 family [Variovorax sp. RA8]|uniref:methyltransferase, TIGR04325 family n=1 Tax=Variovorax sp. (strain JCM 16519 / RA8) TaxID=662548 RepID=UPI0013165D2F|nr:methyltransferase, TIGR04325 family [Variovorax sp. RA8]VTU44700.1 hypothetical protein RA8P2_00222 [Variovorax sp. RA8]